MTTTTQDTDPLQATSHKDVMLSMTAMSLEDEEKELRMIEESTADAERVLAEFNARCKIEKSDAEARRALDDYDAMLGIPVLDEGLFGDIITDEMEEA